MKKVIANYQIKSNTLYSLFGNILPILIYFISTPIVINNIGNSKFGILLLILLFIGVSNIFDFGTARAITHSISRYEEHNKRIQVFVNGLILLLCFGILMAIVIYVSGNQVIQSDKYTKLPFHDELLTTIYLVSLTSIFTMLLTAFRALWEGLLLFKVSAILNSASSVLTMSTLVIISYFSQSLIILTIGILISKVILLIINKLYLNKYFKISYFFSNISKASIKELFEYGKWVAISNISGELSKYIDRFIVAGIISVSVFSYYAVPVDFILKYLIIPFSLISVFFPVIVRIQAGSELYSLYKKIHLYMAGITLIPLFLIGYFSYEFLSVWINEDFAKNSHLILTIATFGVFIASFNTIPYSFLQALKHVKITAAVHSISLPIYLLTLIYIVQYYGMNGAVIAWLIRNVILYVIFSWFALKKIKGI